MARKQWPRRKANKKPDQAKDPAKVGEEEETGGGIKSGAGGGGQKGKPGKAMGRGGGKIGSKIHCFFIHCTKVTIPNKRSLSPFFG